MIRRCLGVGVFGGTVVICLAACGFFGGGSAPSPLSYSNGTTLSIDLVVNGSTLLTAAPGAGGEVAVSALPPLPWSVSAQTSSGRVLKSMTVRAGDVTTVGNVQKGDAFRVDLSCGRLDVWTGPPLLGPAPGPGTPGDCNP